MPGSVGKVRESQQFYSVVKDHLKVLEKVLWVPSKVMTTIPGPALFWYLSDIKPSEPRPTPST